MSKISDTLNTITDFSNSGDPHWCSSNREIYPKSEKLGISNVKIAYDFSEMPIIKETNEKKQGKEVVDHPSHYNHGKYECIDVIDDLKLNFNLGSAFKYIWRMGLKDDEVTELEKAVWYLQREIENRKRAKNEKENK